MLCLAFFSVEAQVADVHDGDATAMELLEDGVSHGGGHAARAGIVLEKNGSAAANDDTGGKSRNDDKQPVHSEHVCHCVHAHGAVYATRESTNTLSLLDASAPATRPARMPPSQQREPQLRPPIAT